MKKIFAILALAGIMTSCKDKKKEEKKMEDTTITTPTTTEPTTTTPTATEPTTTSSDVPKFADAEVQKYVDDYTAFVKGYVDAYKTKDMTKIQQLSASASEWSSKSVSISQKLAGNTEEAMKFSNYITKLSQEITAAMSMK